jgi:SAM-dependent methyltransferase
MKKYKLSRLAHAAAARWLPGRQRLCVACGQHVGWFLPHRGGWRAAPPLMRALNIIGSDLDHVECPACGASDRERHLLLYMEETGIFHAINGQTVVHFAPERAIARHILQSGPARYVRCDLFPSDSHVEQVDMLAMPFDDASVDLLIANHVLEHVADDLRALDEVRRILKPGGRAILQTPYSTKLSVTWSDSGITDDEARLHAYGQEDHVRLYASDIFMRLSSSGLQSCIKKHNELLQHFDAITYGVNQEEPFFLFIRL